MIQPGTLTGDERFDSPRLELTTTFSLRFADDVRGLVRRAGLSIESYSKGLIDVLEYSGDPLEMEGDGDGDILTSIVITRRRFM